MATYHQIQEYVKAHYGFQPKTCWIADVKEQVGFPQHRSFIRQNWMGSRLAILWDMTDKR
jgi:hypothetical protein